MVKFKNRNISFIVSYNISKFQYGNCHICGKMWPECLWIMPVSIKETKCNINFSLPNFYALAVNMLNSSRPFRNCLAYLFVCHRCSFPSSLKCLIIHAYLETAWCIWLPFQQLYFISSLLKNSLETSIICVICSAACWSPALPKFCLSLVILHALPNRPLNNIVISDTHQEQHICQIW